MTVISAVAQPDGVWMACDSQSERNGVRMMLATPKTMRAGRWLIGMSGSQSIVNQVQRKLDAFDTAETIWQVADKLKARASEAADPSPGEEKGWPPTWPVGALVTDGAAIWEIDSAFAVVHVEGAGATGSGREAALGAAAALTVHRPRMSAEQMARAMVEAAIAVDTSCGGPVFAAFAGTPSGAEGPTGSPAAG